MAIARFIAAAIARFVAGAIARPVHRGPTSIMMVVVPMFFVGRMGIHKGLNSCV